MKRLLKRIEALFAAAAFAEEGDAETARRIVDEADAAEGAPDRGPSPIRPPRPVPPSLPLPTRARGA